MSHRDLTADQLEDYAFDHGLQIEFSARHGHVTHAGVTYRAPIRPVEPPVTDLYDDTRLSAAMEAGIDAAADRASSVVEPMTDREADYAADLYFDRVYGGAA